MSGGDANSNLELFKNQVPPRPTKEEEEGGAGDEDGKDVLLYEFDVYWYIYCGND